MNFLAITALWSIIAHFSCAAFILNTRPSRQWPLSVRMMSSRDDFQPGSSRRLFLQSFFSSSAASLLFPTDHSSYADDSASQNDIDILSDFSESINANFKPQDLYGTTSSWPNTPSPLPTMFKTAAELSSSTPPTNINIANDLNQAIEEAANRQKRRIDPRTHG